MYKPRMRDSAQNSLPSLKKIFATRSITCICHRQIKIGDSMFFDGWTNSYLCLSCGSMPSGSTVVAHKEPDDWQRGHDRMRALENLPGPLKVHLQEELDNLQMLYGEKAREPKKPHSVMNEWLQGRYAEYSGPCSRCKTWQKAGAFIAYHRVQRVIICALCL